MVIKILTYLLFVPILFLEAFLGWEVFWGEKILPQVKIDDLSLSGLTKQEALQALEVAITQLKLGTVKIGVSGQTFEIPVKNLGLEFEVEKTVEAAYSLGHSTNLFKNLVDTVSLIVKPVNLEIDFLLADEELDKFLAKMTAETGTEIRESQLEVRGEKIEFIPGKAGKRIDQQTLRGEILKNFSKLKSVPLNAKVTTIEPEIPQEASEAAKLAAKKFVGKKIILSAPTETFEIDTNQILQFLSPKILTNFELAANRTKVEKFVKEKLSPKMSKEPVDAKFQFDGTKVVVFQPAADGVKLEVEKTTEILYQTLNQNLLNQTKIELPVVVTHAKIKTGDVNNLGISELIGRGVSNFAGSAPERTHNIKLAASKITGTLLAPGEVFSFNQTIGEISTATGYTSAYIISKGRTILGEGGGVCQVSTTVFRAAVAAGLEIVDRRAHAYRVRYYEQGGHKVGLDATIFVPSVDFKFKNDTQNNILIQAYTKGQELYFDFYGTADGRIIEVSKPTVTNVRPAPEPLYEEDPTLPAGTKKQVDFAAIGASVTVTRTVKKAGQVLYSDIFRSNYKPWQAIYKVGTGGQL